MKETLFIIIIWELGKYGIKIILMLDDLELRYKVLSDAQMLQACGAIEGTIEYAKSLIIKEKEQIMDAYRDGLVASRYNGNENTEEYYNQIYNL